MASAEPVQHFDVSCRSSFVLNIMAVYTKAMRACSKIPSALSLIFPAHLGRYSSRTAVPFCGI